VTNVPRGVCESLVPKAAVEYKVRVMPGSEEKYLVPQMANIGTVYDSFHKDICTNDTNDVVLYFNDTSPYCNKPDEGEDYTKCLSNADCCGEYFCWIPEEKNCHTPAEGRCKLITTFNPETMTMDDGKTWTRSGNGKNMNWWSTQNWCAALGLRPVSRADLGCGDVSDGAYCSSSTLSAIQRNDKWKKYGGHWLEDYGNSCVGYGLAFYNSFVWISYRYFGDGYYYALCH